jgi:preprotein translocase subunit SecA
MNEQREIIYDERRRVLDGESMRDVIYNMITEHVEKVVDKYISSELGQDTWDLESLNRDLYNVMLLPPVTMDEIKGKSQKELKHILKERAVKGYEAKEAEFPEPEQIREAERVVLLKAIDTRWMEHIDDMDQLRQGIGLQAYGQKNPLVEYKMIGYDLFDEMTENIATNTIRMLFHIRVEQKVEREQVAKVTGTNKDDSLVRAPKKREEKKVYPNDPCPCGSGKKYKQCCGRK